MQKNLKKKKKHKKQKNTVPANMFVSANMVPQRTCLVLANMVFRHFWGSFQQLYQAVGLSLLVFRAFRAHLTTFAGANHVCWCTTFAGSNTFAGTAFFLFVFVVYLLFLLFFCVTLFFVP